MVRDEIEVLREGIDGSFHAEAIFFYEAQACQCGKPLKKCIKKTCAQDLQNVKYTSCLGIQQSQKKCFIMVVGKPAKVLLLCKSFSPGTVPSKQVVKKRSLFVVRNIVTSRRQDLLLIRISK